LEITGEPSHTVEEAGKTNSHFGSVFKNWLSPQNVFAKVEAYG
jgi:hypothetical protein